MARKLAQYEHRGSRNLQPYGDGCGRGFTTCSLSPVCEVPKRRLSRCELLAGHSPASHLSKPLRGTSCPRASLWASDCAILCAFHECLLGTRKAELEETPRRMYTAAPTAEGLQQTV